MSKTVTFEAWALALVDHRLIGLDYPGTGPLLLDDEESASGNSWAFPGSPMPVRVRVTVETIEEDGAE